MRFARWVFLIAGIYGVLILTPILFTETAQRRMSPPPINHPEYYYGFTSVALVCQGWFFLIAKDPVRFRPLMALAVLEKLSFFATCLILLVQHRMSPAGPFFGGMIDGVWMLLFAIAWVRLSPS